ncbi:MAG TPA: hypothetical protein VMF13_23525 [Luteitalea sp.]|nr:hypothetical protein [Luteitalea sp.]
MTPPAPGGPIKNGRARADGKPRDGVAPASGDAPERRGARLELPVTTPEKIVIGQFSSMPLPVRVITYLLFVLVLVNHALGPTVIQGDFYVLSPDGVRVPGEKYTIRAHGTQDRVNADGRWTLTLPRSFLGSADARIGSPNAEVIGDVRIPVPLPLLSAFRPSRPVIDATPQGRSWQFSVIPMAAVGDLSPVLHAATKTAEASSNPVFVELRRIQCKQTDRDNDTGQIYFFVYLNKRLVEPFGWPSVKVKGSRLSLTPNVPLNLTTLRLQLPASSASSQFEFGLRIYDFNSGLFAKNPDRKDELGALKRIVLPHDLGVDLEMVPIQSANDVPTGNCSVTIRTVDK